MNKCLLYSVIILVVTLLASCQPQHKESQSSPAEAIDTAATQTIKAAETGYAEVDGLKMYYEVYGQGSPVVLLHGSYMNIPMNWAHIIPLLAKDRKVIVAEMQATVAQGILTGSLATKPWQTMCQVCSNILR